MSFESMPQVKNSLQSLTESVWVFSALSIIVESGALAVLNEKKTINELVKITNIPETILEKTVHLLVEAGFLTFKDRMIELSPSMQESMQDSGVEKIISQLRITFGLTSEFIKSSREKNIRAGWYYTDELLLQAQGTHSEYVVTDCIPQNIKLQNKLRKKQAFFLDVGAGVAKISLRLCQLYENVKIVALEPADVPFLLAKKNITESKYADRIELRKMDLENMLEKNEFDVIWFPHVFFHDSILETSLFTVWDALKPDGMLITNAISSDKMNQSALIRHLINSLYGGLRTGNELINTLTNVGFQDIQQFSEISGYRTITATK